MSSGQRRVGVGRRLLRGVARLPLGAAVALAVVWGVLALWIDGPAARPVAGALAAAWGVGCAVLLLGVRPRRRALGLLALAFAALLAWWLSIPPSNDRDWLPDVARLTTAEIDGDRVTLHNVRSFEYRSESDFTERWVERTLDLRRVRGLDLYVAYWGSDAIAHTIVSWDVEGEAPLAISIETRKEVGETYSALRGFFRQFELYYVVADERDVIRLRTDYRGDQLYLYRIAMSAERARELLLAYLEEINRLAREPRWYNALMHNCTTSIRLHVQQIGIRNPWSWKLLLNGHVDELLYERRTISTSLPFAELRARSHINGRARAARGDPDFSRRIREGLPERPPAL